MRSTDELIVVGKRFMSMKDLAPSTFGRLSVGSSTAWQRLLRGALTIRTADRMMRYVVEQWPEGIDWPDDISRPAPAEEVAA